MLINAITDGSKSYAYNEPKLGTRASHGCIRVQRLRNTEGLTAYIVFLVIRSVDNRITPSCYHFPDYATPSKLFVLGGIPPTDLKGIPPTDLGGVSPIPVVHPSPKQKEGTPH